MNNNWRNSKKLDNNNGYKTSFSLDVKKLAFNSNNKLEIPSSENFSKIKSNISREKDKKERSSMETLMEKSLIDRLERLDRLENDEEKEFNVDNIENKEKEVPAKEEQIILDNKMKTNINFIHNKFNETKFRKTNNSNNIDLLTQTKFNTKYQKDTMFDKVFHEYITNDENITTSNKNTTSINFNKNTTSNFFNKNNSSKAMISKFNINNMNIQAEITNKNNNNYNNIVNNSVKLVDFLASDNFNTFYNNILSSDERVVKSPGIKTKNTKLLNSIKEQEKLKYERKKEIKSLDKMQRVNRAKSFYFKDKLEGNFSKKMLDSFLKKND